MYQQCFRICAAIMHHHVSDLQAELLRSDQITSATKVTIKFHLFQASEAKQALQLL